MKWTSQERNKGKDCLLFILYSFGLRSSMPLWFPLIEIEMLTIIPSAWIQLSQRPGLLAVSPVWDTMVSRVLSAECWVLSAPWSQAPRVTENVYDVWCIMQSVRTLSGRQNSNQRDTDLLLDIWLIWQTIVLMECILCGLPARSIAQYIGCSKR